MFFLILSLKRLLIGLVFVSTRFGASEVGCVCASMGALAAQATLKIITRQYVPFNNTVIFNFMNATLDRFEF
jgi:hypothetical protein